MRFGPMADHSQSRTEGLAIAGMVLGILALVSVCFWFFAIPCAVVGLVLSAVGMKSTQRQMAIAGLVCSMAAVALTLVLPMILVALATSASHR